MRFSVAVGTGFALTALAGALFAGGSAAQSTTTVAVGDLYFCAPSFQNGVCETTISEGDSVEWQFAGAQPHTTTACADDLDACSEPRLWDSGFQSSGSFSHTFEAAGTYLYRCQVHPDEMRGRVVVLAAAQPSPSPSPSPVASEPAATPTPALQPTVVPSGGGAASDGGSGFEIAAAAIGGLLAGAGMVLSARALRRRSA